MIKACFLAATMWATVAVFAATPPPVKNQTTRAAVKGKQKTSKASVVAVRTDPPKNKTTGIDCSAVRFTGDGGADRTFAQNDTDDQSGQFMLAVGSTHEVEVKFLTGSRQIVSSELYRKSDRSVVLERFNVDITYKCDEQTDIGYADEVLDAFEGGVSTEHGPLIYGCAATCALPTRPDGNR